ncbi:hypothetical protein J1N10_15720 [Carboxylicivirga sp. A043]|uniref:hypothetical protein n=1 Tax=Carboxylicivirga litoralis TaxID=2816963 RepID=UPI0021CB8941|nr:hypothetical protein [Carboxylicivirga sp. A043]MCU4157425.1 hypothetical protein [Carboxylicivirga sp. A043]
MGLRYLDVKKSQLLLLKKEKGMASPARRSFLRTLSIGALAWSPLVEAAFALSKKPFRIVKRQQQLYVYQKGRIAWELSSRIFEDGYHLELNREKDAYHIKANGLRYHHTDFSFDLTASIQLKHGEWRCLISIPQLSISQEMGFLSWLDGKTVKGKIQPFTIVDSALLSVKVSACSVCQLNVDWKLDIQADKSLVFQNISGRYVGSAIQLSPNAGNASFIKPRSNKVTYLCLEKFDDWYRFVNIHLPSHPLANKEDALPDLNFQLNEDVAIWTSDSNGRISHQLSKGNAFNKSFLFTEYHNNQEPEVYLTASLHDCWMPTELGSFHFNQTDKQVDYEYHGRLTGVVEERFQPQWEGFKPLVDGAVGLSSIVNELSQLNISPQEPVKRKSNTNQLTIAQDKVIFKPKKALRFRVLRPEDMLILEFELHNFSLVRQGAISFAELSNANKKGLLIISFTSQHTLEEAYFESNNIPGVPSSDSVTLPARHLRARKSRLVYELPAKSKGIPLTIEHLLNWSYLKLRVNPRAWIKLPKAKSPQKGVSRNSAVATPANKQQYLQGESKDYAIKLYAHSRIKADKQNLYADGQLGQLLPSDKVQTVKPGFNIYAVKNINLNVEPIPLTDTSIEAPTLMYISPNQVNDFVHERQLKLREHQEQKQLIGKAPGNFNLAADNLTTNKGSIAELWHTILGVKLKNSQTSRQLSAFKTIRALWADEANADYKILPPLGQPFMASLDGNDRHVLVHTTSNYSIPHYYPKAVPVKNLMLTSLGAYLDWHAFFDVPSPADTELNIIEWEHLATLGRDHYVKVVREGYLFPFGHRAALVKVTERKFHKGTKAAVNRQRMYIVVLEKEVLYERNNPNNQFIPFAFQAVQINTTQTPNIDNPLEEPIIDVPSGNNQMKLMVLSEQNKKFGSTGNTAYNFYINVNKKGFLFDLVLTDKEGQEHALRMPLVFLENRVARKTNLVQQIIGKYNPNELYNKMELNEQDIAYAESMLDGDTSFETQTIQFGAEVYPVTGEADIKFHPVVQKAEVFIKQLNEMTGVRRVATIQLEDDQNEGAVFASVKDAVVDFSNGSDKAGGFMSPNMGISALSKLQGPVGGEIADSKALQFNPDDFFKALEEFPVAKIFGVIKIFDLLLGDMNLSGAFDGVKNATSQAKQEIESIKTEILYLENQAKELQQDLSDQINNLKQAIKDKTNELLDLLNGNIPKIPNFKTFVTAEAFYAEYKWQPEFKSNPIKVIEDVLHVNVDAPNKALTITTALEKPFDGSKEASFSGSARFEKFGIDLVPLLAVNFNYMEFKTGNAQKTNVKVDINAEKPIEFKGALSFVNNLQNIIPSTGFSDDGPYIKLQATQVTAGFTIGIPNVEVGICMISNISLGAHVTLPFTGAPLELGFNFCKRENPFMLTISCFGGGGYFMMITTLKGLKSIEAAFEFGAAMSLNVGVASGGVSVMGGIYYKFELIEKVLPTPDGDIVEEIGSSTIVGYLRINGHLSILGIISLSMEFYLAFIAVFSDGKVQKLEGVATVKVKVEVLFFSKTVKVTVRRELKGADADPKFIEMIDEDDWQEYCLAFAG